MRAKHPATWGVGEAKARFSEVIDRALSEGPQTITRRGKRSVVVVAAELWACAGKRKPKGNLAEFFAASPLPGSDLEIERVKDRPQDLDL